MHRVHLFLVNKKNPYLISHAIILNFSKIGMWTFKIGSSRFLVVKGTCSYKHNEFHSNYFNKKALETPETKGFIIL